MCLCGERGTGKQLLVEQKRVSDPLLLELLTLNPLLEKYMLLTTEPSLQTLWFHLSTKSQLLRKTYSQSLGTKVWTLGCGIILPITGTESHERAYGF